MELKGLLADREVQIIKLEELLGQKQGVREAELSESQ